MIVDTSAIVAVALQEPSSRQILVTSRNFPEWRISAATLLECWMVLGRRVNPVTMDAILAKFDLAVEPVTLAQVEIARVAFNQFGKGSGHGARFNFGDCFAYALAKHLDEPLLFVGDDLAERHHAGHPHRAAIGIANSGVTHDARSRRHHAAQ